MIDQQTNTKKWIQLGLFTIIAFALVIYFYQNNPSDAETTFLRCPSNLILGINCPGCGSQRAFHHLLHLEIKEAFRYNALFVLAFPFVIYWLGIKIYNFIFDTKKTTRIPTNKFVWIGLSVLVLLFGIMRNVSFYPFTLLIP